MHQDQEQKDVHNIGYNAVFKNNMALFYFFYNLMLYFTLVINIYIRQIYIIKKQGGEIRNWRIRKSLILRLSY